MIKKILVLVLLLVLLFPVGARANDGGAYWDEEEYLKIEYLLHSNEVEIGGTLDFSLTLTNKTKYSIWPHEILSIFRNTKEHDLDYFKYRD